MTDLRAADQTLAWAIAETISALDLTEKDSAAVRLARDYADAIDTTRGDPKIHAWAMRNLAPLLLDALEALGATPAARNRLKGGKTPDAAPNQLAKLRAARRA